MNFLIHFICSIQQTGTGIVKKRPSAWEKSLTTEAYKIMKDKLPDDVKSGKHISVQNRLAKALSKSSATGTKTELVNESGSVNENMAMQASSGAYRGQCWYNSVEQAKETLAYKVMEPKLPPVVKEGARVSATDRLVILMDRELEMDAYNAQYGAEDPNRQVGDEKMECDVPDYSHLLEVPKFSDLKFDVKTEEHAKKFVATAFKFWELNCLNRLSESEMEILNDKLDELEKVYPNTCKFSSAQ